MSESLVINTTLTILHLDGERRTFFYHAVITFLVFFSLFDNTIEDEGATMISESLKKNTSLTELYLRGWYYEDK